MRASAPCATEDTPPTARGACHVQWGRGRRSRATAPARRATRAQPHVAQARRTAAAAASAPLATGPVLMAWAVRPALWAPTGKGTGRVRASAAPGIVRLWGPHHRHHPTAAPARTATRVQTASPKCAQRQLLPSTTPAALLAPMAVLSALSSVEMGTTRRAGRASTAAMQLATGTRRRASCNAIGTAMGYVLHTLPHSHSSSKATCAEIA